MNRQHHQRNTRRVAATIASAIAALFAMSHALANTNTPAPAQSKPILITGATLHTVSGAVIPNGRLLFDKGRIVSVSDASGTSNAGNATVLDLSGKHIYPGFISANSAIGLGEVEAVRATIDNAEVGAINPNVRALVAVNPDSEIIPVTRANGVLTVLAAPGPGRNGLISGTSALIQLDGWTYEDLGLVPEVALHVSLPAMRFNADLFPAPSDVLIDDMRKETTKRLTVLEDAFEAAAAYSRAKAHGDVQKPDVRWEAMLPVMAGQRPVFMQAYDVAQIRYALNFAERFKLKLTLVGGADAWRMADLLRERKVGVILDGMHQLPTRRGEDFDTVYRAAAILSKAGVTFCIARSATIFDANSERNLPFEAASAVAFGLSKEEALKAITLYPAQMLGVADKLGSLDTGKLATFFVSNGDPMEYNAQVERAFIQGREIDLNNRQLQLKQKYEEKYRQRAAGQTGR